MNGQGDVRIIALKCPNCGGALRVPEGTDRTVCEHCKSTVVVIDGRNGRAAAETSGGGAPISEEAKRRVIKVALWGTAISVGIPIVIVAVVFIVLAVVFLALGLFLAGSGG